MSELRAGWYDEGGKLIRETQLERDGTWVRTTEPPPPGCAYFGVLTDGGMTLRDAASVSPERDTIETQHGGDSTP